MLLARYGPLRCFCSAFALLCSLVLPRSSPLEGLEAYCKEALIELIQQHAGPQGYAVSNTPKQNGEEWAS